MFGIPSAAETINNLVHSVLGIVERGVEALERHNRIGLIRARLDFNMVAASANNSPYHKHDVELRDALTEIGDDLRELREEDP